MSSSGFCHLASLALAFAPRLPMRAQVTERATVTSIAGCYAMAAGTWSTPITWDGYSLPPVLGFDTLVATRGRLTSGVDTTTWRTLRPNPTPGSTSALATWALVGPDSIAARWYRGRSGDQLLLGVHGDTLRGSVTAYGDAGNGGMPNPTAKVTGVRSVCSAKLK